MASLLRTPGTVALLDERGAFVMVRHAGGEAELLYVGGPAGGAAAGAWLARCSRRSSEAQAGPVFLEVAADNAAARGLYDSAGFVPCGVRPDYYGPGRDALVLRRDRQIGSAISA